MKFGDKVKITNGFYSGLEGVLVEQFNSTAGIISYTVKLDNQLNENDLFFSVRIYEKDLEKIGE